MNRSESIKELAGALAKAQGEMLSAKKDAANPFFKSHYAPLSSIVDAIREPLSKNGLAYVQTTETEAENIGVETTLLHASGEWISTTLWLRPIKADPQGIGSCITYARRYGLQALVGIAADEDDDGNAASGAVVTAKAQVQSTTAKPKQQSKTPAVENEAQPVEAAAEMDRDALILQIKADALAIMVSDGQLTEAANKYEPVEIWTDAKIETLNRMATRLADARAAKGV